MMRKRFVFPLGLTLLLGGVAACGASGDEAPPLDDALRRDLSLASAATSTAPVVFGDTAAGEPAPTPVVEPTAPPVASPAPRRVPAPAPRPTPERAPEQAPQPAPDAPPLPAPEATPAPAEPAPAPARRTLLAAGATLTGPTGTRVCNTTNRPGDRVVMRTTDDVRSPDGTRLPAGTPVLLELTAATDSTLAFRVVAVSHDGELHPVTATASVDGELEASRVSGGSDKKKVIGGAIAGAIIGQILGKDTKSTVIGAAGGAAAGTAAAARSGTSERCLAAGATVRVVLHEPLLVAGTGA